VPAPFRIVVQMERDVVRICPFGEVDIDTVGQIREQIETLTAARVERVVLDLRDVPFLDSTGCVWCSKRTPPRAQADGRSSISLGRERGSRSSRHLSSRLYLPRQATQWHDQRAGAGSSVMAGVRCR
jgi:hypothetical protein